MKEKKTSEYIGDFLTFYRNLISKYEYMKNALSDDDEATQDILHQIEFGGYEDRRRYVTRLANVRKKRRVHKNFVEINSKLYAYFKDPNIVKVYRTLEQMLGDIRKQEKLIEGKRTYRPRIIKDLTIETTDTKD